MGKIIGKSALCFAGLCVVSGLIKALTDWLFIVDKPAILTIINLTVLTYILWLLLPAAYAYILFRLFRNNEHSILIIGLNGVFIIIQFFVLLLLRVNTDVLLVSTYLSDTCGIPVIMLGIMFRKLISGKQQVKKVSTNKVLGITAIIAKSVLCFILLTAVSIGFDVLHGYFTSALGIFGLVLDTPLFFIPLFAVLYAYYLYRLLKSNARRRLLLIINSMGLIIICGLSLLFPEQFNALNIISPLVLTIFVGNTALLNLVLAFIFSNVERSGYHGDMNISKKSTSGTGFQSFQAGNDTWVG